MSKPIRVPAHISKFERFRRHGLSESEAHLMDMIRHGFSNKAVASELKMTDSSVRKLMYLSLGRLGLRCRNELIALWRNGEN